MNCTQCREHLADFLEKAVTPLLRRRMSAHLEECEECATGLRELEVALGHLRGLAVVAPPAGLAARVTDRLLASPPLAARPEPGPEPRRRHGERTARGAARARLRPVLAAAGLLIAAASFFAGHLVGGRRSSATLAALGEARSRVGSLETQLRDTRTSLVEENASLKDELISLRRGLDEWKIEHESALEKERETRRDLDRRLEEATRRIETQAETLVALQSRLDAAAEERDRAIAGKDEQARELQVARAELAEARRVTAEARARRAAIPAQSESRWSGYRESPPVLFVREGEVLRLKTRGPFDEVGPRLFALAESAAEPEMADLALTTLETHLGHYAPEEEPSGAARAPSVGDGIAGWFSRVGIVNAAPEEAAESTTDRAARLERLRRIWQERFPAPDAPR